MNTSLKYFDGVFIIPVLQVFWTFFAVLGACLGPAHAPRYTAAALVPDAPTTALHLTRLPSLGPSSNRADVSCADGFIYFQDYEDYHPGRMTGFIL